MLPALMLSAIVAQAQAYRPQVLRTALESSFAIPAVYVNVDSPPGRPAPYYSDLVKAGILERYIGQDTWLKRVTEYRLTRRGRTFAANHLWDVRHHSLRIPVGRDRVTRLGTAHVEDAHTSYVDFAFRGSLNWQGRALLAIGPARDWLVGGGFPRCATTLDRLGREGHARAELWAHDGIVEARCAKSWGESQCR